MANFYQPKKAKSLPTQHQSVVIERLDHQGVGIASYNNRPLFVDGVLPTEQVLVQLVEQKSKYARGKLISIQTPSTQRIDAFCPHYANCGGCNLQHLEHGDQIAFKGDALANIMHKYTQPDFKLEDAIVSKPTGYRRRARISLFFDTKEQKLHFGFRQKKQNQIINITSCPVLVPELEALLLPLKETLSQIKQPRFLGHVEVVFDGEKKAVVLRHMEALTTNDLALLKQFESDQDAVVYLLPSSGELQAVSTEPAGSAETIDKLVSQETGNKISFLPNDFIQINQDVNQKMVQQAMDWLNVDSSESVLDLFCGLGNFSLALAKQAHKVVGVEGIEAMVERARSNAKLNSLTNLSFYQADLEKSADSDNWKDWGVNKFDKILLDPARAGAQGIIENIAKFEAKSILYVSCNPATLARDSEQLQRQGYELTKLGMLDMFPHTSHLESMALFVKTDGIKGGIAKARQEKTRSKTEITTKISAITKSKSKNKAPVKKFRL